MPLSVSFYVRVFWTGKNKKIFATGKDLHYFPGLLSERRKIRSSLVA